MKKLGIKVLWGHKDGGPESEVRCWGLEIKALFSVMLLQFTHKTREEFHSHAFNSISWVLRGWLHEVVALPNGRFSNYLHDPSIKPVMTYRDTLHRVHGSRSANWVLTFRGPWADTWQDGQPGNTDTLTHGRVKV